MQKKQKMMHNIKHILTIIFLLLAIYAHGQIDRQTKITDINSIIELEI